MGMPRGIAMWECHDILQCGNASRHCDVGMPRGIAMGECLEALQCGICWIKRVRVCHKTESLDCSTCLPQGGYRKNPVSLKQL